MNKKTTDEKGKRNGWLQEEKLFSLFFLAALGSMVIIVMLLLFLVSNYTFGTNTTTGIVTAYSTNNFLIATHSITFLKGETIYYLNGNFSTTPSLLNETCTVTTSGFSLMSYSCK
jgi:hypothetical protein